MKIIRPGFVGQILRTNGNHNEWAVNEGLLDENEALCIDIDITKELNLIPPSILKRRDRHATRN